MDDEENLRRLREQASTEQQLQKSIEMMTVHLPRMWRSLYEACCQSGFSDEKSFVLVCVYILSQSPGGINGVPK